MGTKVVSMDEIILDSYRLRYNTDLTLQQYINYILVAFEFLLYGM